jgi:hypothetical protein
VDKVLVYSNQARVFRAATVALTGKPKELALADLPEAVIPDTVRVESKTAKVARVVVVRARGQLPRQVKTKELVGKIEAITDKLRDLGGEEAVLKGERGFIRSLKLRREPQARRPRPPAEGLFTDAWRRILVWMEGRSSKIQARLATISKERRKLKRSLHKLRVEAKGLDPASMNQVVSRVKATLEGRPGKHRVVVSYLVSGVRWVPSYDLRYVPSRRTVEATYYAVVDQRSGEDWEEARMRFSTGLPTQLLAVPELPTWTLGRKRDFIPTPRARVERAPMPWVPPPPSLVTDPVIDSLQQVLREATAAATGEVVLHGYVGDGETARDRPPPPPKPSPRPRPRRRSYDFSDDRIEGRMVRPQAAARRYPSKRRPYPASPAPAGAPPPEPMEEAALEEATVSSGRTRALSRRVFGGRSRHVPQETLPWTDAGYRPPAIHKDLPAAAAEGYIFTLYAPGRHTIAASGARQRVPVLRRVLKVRPVYQIRPGLSKRAYLVAEVRNTTGRPILRGHANLFAGEMFSGRSWLNTALPGKTIELPLGVDDGIKVERHLRQKTVVHGVLFKDDVTEYTVQIEIANHHRYPIRVELRDQIPVKMGRKIEIKAFTSKPKMELVEPDKQGKVTWEGSIKGRSVEKLSFTFQLVRPKDWEVRQHDG